MPAAIGILLFLLLRAFVGLLVSVRNAVGEGNRRLRGAYEMGYAIVPEGSLPGDTVGPERFVVARDPVWLPAWVIPGDLARIASVTGVKAKMRNRGWWWEAASAVVVELLPPWVLFGPSGYLVTDVISTTLEVPYDRADVARSTLEPAFPAALIDADEWRSALAVQIRSGTVGAIRNRLANDVRQEFLDRSDDDETLTTLMNRSFEARAIRWAAAIEATVHAGFAAGWADELDPPAIERLSADWQKLIAWVPGPRIETTGTLQRVVRLAHSPVTFIERHPTVSVVITLLVIIMAFAVNPYAALVSFGLLLVVTPLLLVRRSLLRGRHVRRRRWEPRGNVNQEVPAPRRLRTAMAGVNGTGSAIALAHLITLLRHADVWVALEGPQPGDPERTLAWQSRNAQPLPIALHGADEEVLVLAYTDSARHRSARHTHAIAWTTRVAFSDLVKHARNLGATGIVVDAGCVPATYVSTDVFGHLDLNESGATLPSKEH
jgi:hypothetical protein